MKDSYFSDVVLDWTLKHPEMKEDFELVFEYQAPFQAFHIRMEYVPYHHGMCELLGEDVLDKLVCPHDYIFATLDRMYKTLKEDEEVERRKLQDYVKSWILIYTGPRDKISFHVRPEGLDGYMVSFKKDVEDELIGNTIIVKRYIPKKKVENWDADEGYVAEALSNMYRRLKEKEKKEMGKITCGVKVDNDQMLKMAKAAVVAWYNEHNAPDTIGMEDVYITWFCKVLQNWKALAGTHHSDGMYYEVTYDGDKDAAYVDAYKKWQNVSMSGEDIRDNVRRW